MQALDKFLKTTRKEFLETPVSLDMRKQWHLKVTLTLNQEAWVQRANTCILHQRISESLQA